MTITTNVNPYYDDFDEFKNFHQILFKPGFAVQARELTQLQTIIQDQIKKFGSHIFKHGSVVLPGNSYADLTSPYAKLQNFNTLLSSSQIEGKVVVGSVTGIRAFIRKFSPAAGNDPDTIFVNYLRGSTTSNVFLPNETLTFENTTTVLGTLATSNPTGFGSLGFINTGVFFVNGKFVTVDSQSVIISKYDSQPSAHVVLKIQESIITIDDDSTLFDPAQGSYNYAAPGADRYKIDLVLDVIPYDTTITDDIIELMRYNSGTLEEHLRYPSYNELEKQLARRTYDESGDYVSNGLDTTIRENKKIDLNGGLDLNGSIDKFVATVSSGKAYIKGFETEKISSTNLILDKGRTADHIKTKTAIVQPKFGQYLYVTNLRGALPTDVPLKQVNLYTANTGGTLIGTLRVSAIDFHEGDYAGKVVFKLYFNSLSLTAGSNIESIGKISYTVGGTTYSMTVLQNLNVPGTIKDFLDVETVTNQQNSNSKAIVYHWFRSSSNLYVYRDSDSFSVPILGNSIVGETSGASGIISQKTVVSSSNQSAQVFYFPVDSVNKIKNSSNLTDISYKVYKNVTITLDSTGSGSTTIDSGTIDSPFEAGNSVFIGPSGIVQFGSNTITATGGNTVQITNSGLPNGTKVYGVISVIKTLSQKTKTKTTITETVSVVSGVATLSNSDIYSITSISASGVDVTKKFTLDNGQRDYAYLRGSLTYNSSDSAPTSISVTYDYFAHSSGDYFTADSYTTLGSSYLSLIPSYIAKSDGSIYSLRNCIDFRQKETSAGVFSSMDLVQPESFISTSIQYYVPRIDTVYMNKDGRIGVVTGEPKESPVRGNIPSGTISLCDLYIPAYTSNISDIIVTKAKNKGYTMADVAKLEDRLYNLEQYALLSQTENSLVNYDVIDSVTGKSRYKSGYLVETFNDPNMISDILSKEFKATYSGGKLYPATEQIDVALTYSATDSNCKNTNGLLTLDYVDTVLTKQNLSTRVTNINPFSVFVWRGNLTISPSVDNYVEYENLPVIYENINEQQVSVTRSWDSWAPIQAQRGGNGGWNAPVSNSVSWAGADFGGGFSGESGTGDGNSSNGDSGGGFSGGFGTA